MPDLDLNKIEEKILKFWRVNKIFKKSLANRKGKKKFIFYEGPPTANGPPHIGHFETRAFKDLFLRYKTMRGFYAGRRAGWDTHGLPVEIEVEKELGIKSKPEIEKFGIAKFNNRAKQSVLKYKDEWEKFSRRIGFWLDFDNEYFTFKNEYIEILWHIVKRFDKKKFLYQGHKILPWCPRCGTALSSHEVAQGYESVTEDSVFVKFKVTDWTNQSNRSNRTNWSDNTYILSWTTTSWTLPGNVALAVGESIKYQVVSIKGKDEKYILARDRVNEVIKEEYKVIAEIDGKDLVGLEYEPLFKVPSLKSDKSYKVYGADFVNIEEGTGVVHTAVMYGEDDYRLGEKVGLPKHHTVDKEGKFTKDVPEFAGKFVKDAEEDIISYLKKKNHLFKVEPYTHEYPFCWRCKTHLLYYAADSWFVKTTAVKKELLANNKKINWIPDYIKEGRFGQWLKEVKDWAFSRDRYWGTPLPIWVCNQTDWSNKSNGSNRTNRSHRSNRGCGSYLVIGSMEELEKNRYRKPNRYFLMRHAESEKNVLGGKDIVSSKLEHDKYGLTKKGIEQAKRVALRFKKGKGLARSFAKGGYFGIDLIFSSPFLRTKETAKIIANQLGLDFKIDERLKELDHGSVCEGKDHFVCLAEGQYPPENFSIKFGLDGESWDDVKKRMFNFVKELDEKYEGKNILVVSHGDPIWLLEAIVKNWADKEALNLRLSRKHYLKNGEIHLNEFSNYPRNELGELDLHRPYIDTILLKCPKCKKAMRRVPDVIDVWFDSGSMPLASQKGPIGPISPIGLMELKKKIDFPADFIAEGVDQTRGWFYTLLAVSTLLGFGPPYKNVISLGHVLDEDGRKMSKSLGNVVTPDYVINKFGSDVSRWWFYKVNPAGESKTFREEELKEIKNRFVRVILNSLRFWQLYQSSNKTHGSNQSDKSNRSRTLLDKWLLSRRNSLVSSITKSLDNYDATAASREIEKFVIDDLSNWWIRRSRASFQLPAGGHRQDLLKFILLELSKLIAPFTPFLAEHLYSEIRPIGPISPISVHFHDWPKADKKLINKNLEEQMELVRKIASLGLAVRKEAGIKVRQPLNLLYVISNKLYVNEELLDLAKDELNVKNIYLKLKTYNLKQSSNLIKLAWGDLEVALDTEITPVLKEEGWVREFIRMVQDGRRDAGYKYNQMVSAFWFTQDSSLKGAIQRSSDLIKKKTFLKSLDRSGHNPKFVYDVEIESELEPRRKIWLGLKK